VRITHGILQQRALRAIQAGQSGVSEARERVSTKLEVRRASDDPVAASTIMQVSSRLRALDQHRKNVSAAGSRIRIEETVLDQISDALVRARELGLSQIGDTADGGTRETARREVDELSDFVRSLGNTRFGESFLFGGDYADVRPFPESGPDPTRPPEGEHRVEIDEGQTLETNHSGQEIFLDTGLLDAFSELSGALASNDQEAIGNAVTEVDDAFEAVQELLGQAGARAQRVELAEESLGSLEVDLATLRSDLQDADFEAAVTELVARQSSLQAALSVNARIFSTSLVDFL